MEQFDYKKEYESFKWEVPEYYNMGYDCCDKWVDGGQGDKVALYWENEAGQTAEFTFSDYKKLSNKFGNALKKLGLKKGDRFLVRLGNVPEFQAAFLGGLKIGAVPIPVSLMFKAKEIEYRVNDSKAVMMLTSPGYKKLLGDIQGACPSLKHIIVVSEMGGESAVLEEDELSYDELMADAGEDLEIEKTKATDMAFFCYTSGTTGDPKGAVHMHQWGIGNDPNSLYWQAYRKDDIVTHTGNLNWIFPLGNGFIYAWRHGVTVLLYDGRFMADKWYELLEKYKVTNLASVPTAYRIFLTIKEPTKKYDLSNLRYAISAGEPLNAEVVEAWHKEFGWLIHEGIGMTEIMVYLSNMPGMEVRAGSMGRPQPGHRCAIIDKEGNEAPPNTQGMLAIKTPDPGLFREYWNKPDKTEKSFLGDWFVTGDTAMMDPDGYFWFEGRGDDLIMTAGYRVSPFEVESALIEHPAVLEAAAVSSPDEMRGVIVKAFVILQDGEEPSEELAESIKKHVKDTTAPYKYPREIEFVEALPKTQSGKIMRRVLRQIEEEKKGVQYGKHKK